MYWKYDKCMGLNTESYWGSSQKSKKKKYLLVYILSFEVWEYHQTLQNMYLGCVTNFYYRN